MSSNRASFLHAAVIVTSLTVAGFALAQTTTPAAAPAPAGQAPAAPGARAGGPAGGAGRAPATPPIDVPWNDAIPAGTAEHAAKALKESTRHADWVDIKLKDGTNLKSWVYYPERAGKAGVVIAIHDNRGMSDTIRALGDQLAQDGFIAIVPDFLSGKGPNGGGTESIPNVQQAVGGVVAEMNDRLDAAMAFGKALPSSNGKTGVIGFCWGGARSFGYAMYQPLLNAAVVYYGDAAGAADGTIEEKLANMKSPVLGHYGGIDPRINATIPATEAAMKKLGKSYEPHTYEGAGHGFMGQQAGAAGANLKAAQESWPRTLAFFRKNLN